MKMSDINVDSLYIIESDLHGWCVMARITNKTQRSLYINEIHTFIGTELAQRDWRMDTLNNHTFKELGPGEKSDYPEYFL